MANVIIGGAEYTLDIDSKGFASGLRAAEATAKTETSKIGQSFDRVAQQMTTRQSAMVQASTQASAKTAQQWAQAAQKMGVSFDQAAKRFRDAQGHFISEATVTKAVANFKRIEDAASKAARASTAGSGGGGLGSAIGAGTRALGVVGLGLSAAQGISAVKDATQDALQAQLSLNVQYKAAAGLLSDFAKANEQAFGQTSVEIEKSIALTGTLNKNYGLTVQQIMQLTAISADYAAQAGLPLADATKRVSDALRGEAEASEALGVSLQSDFIKATADMTAEQKKNWETLDTATKTQIRYNELIKQYGDVQGAATERAAGALGPYDRLNIAWTNAAKSLGENVNPAVAAGADEMAILIVNVGKAANKFQELAKAAADFAAQGNLKQGALTRGGGLKQGGLFDIFKGQEESTAAPTGVQFGPSPEEVKNIQIAIQEEKRRATVIEETRQADLRRQVTALQDKTAENAEIRADREIKALQNTAAAKIAEIERERQALEVRREEELEAADERRDSALEGIRIERQQLDDSFAARKRALDQSRDDQERVAEDKRDSAIKAIEEEERAHLASLDRQVVQTQKARDAELQAAETKRDGVIAAIEAEADAAARSFEAQIAMARFAREEALESASARRDAALDSLDAERLQETRALEDEERASRRAKSSDDQEEKSSAKKESTSKDNSAKQRQRIQDMRDAAVESIEAERDAREKASDEAIKGIEDQIDLERERHDALMDQLDQEEKQRLGVIDAELKRLDQDERGAGNADTDTRLKGALDDANAQLKIAQANRNKQKQVEATEAVAKAEQDIVKEALDRERDARRDALNEQKDQIQEEISAKQDQAKTELDAKIKSLDAQKTAEQTATKIVIEGLNKQAEETKKSYDKQIASIQSKSSSEGAAATLSKARTTEVNTHAEDALIARRRSEQDAYNAKKAEIETAFKGERDQIELTYDHPTDGVFFNLREQARVAKEQYDLRKLATDFAYNEEKARIDEVYNDGEFGLLFKLKQQADEAKIQYAARTDAVNLAYDAEKLQIKTTFDDRMLKLGQEETEARRVLDAKTRDVQIAYAEERRQIEFTYSNSNKTGLLDLLAQAEADTKTALDAQVASWKAWATDITAEIKKPQDDLDKFLETLKKINDEIGDQSKTSRERKDRSDDPDIEIPGNRPMGGGGAAFPDRGERSAAGGAYHPVVRNAGSNSYVTSGGTHGGYPAADIFAEKGSPIFSPVGGTLESFFVSGGGNAAILRGDDGRAYYFAHGNVPFAGGRIEGGMQIGQVGNTGNAVGTAPHLHFAISSNIRDGFNRGAAGGSGDVNFDSSWWTSGGGAISVSAGALGDAGVTVNLFGREITIGRTGLGQIGAPTGGNDEVMAYIHAAATRRNIDPRIALEIARLESGGSFAPGQPGDFNTNGRASSFGPFQLHYGGLGEPHSARGLGDVFTAQTGLHASDPASYRQQVDFVMSHANRSGWSQFHAWRGKDPWAGIRRYQFGGMIPEPTVLTSLRTGRPYGLAGEAHGMEWITNDLPGSGGGGVTYAPQFHGIGTDVAMREFTTYADRQRALHPLRRR